mgnify:CR=1 FL=1
MAIDRKLKLCKGECGEMKYLFSKGMCKSCWAKLHKKPINPMSEKHKKTIEEYKPIRKKFLEENPICQANVKCNGAEATDVHHTKKKSSKKDWLDSNYFLAVCRDCHCWIEINPTEAKRLGLSINHLK